MARKRVSLDVDNLVRRYVGGEPVKQLSEAFGVSPQTVTRRLEGAGVELRVIRPKLPPLDIGAITARYIAGESCAVIAASLGVNDETIRDRLIKAGVTMRTPGDYNHEGIAVASEALVARYLAGESEKALAEALGIDRIVIRNRLLKAGVQRRGRSESMYLRMSQTGP